MATLLDVVLPVLVIMVMTVVGMALRIEDFRRVRDYPGLVPAAVLGQWVVLTLAAGAMVTLLPLTPAVAGGALLFAVLLPLALWLRRQAGHVGGGVPIV